MTELARRRRAIMGAKQNDPHVLYELKNHVVSTANINTEAKIYDPSKDFSVLFDMDVTDISGTDRTKYCLFFTWDSTLSKQIMYIYRNGANATAFTCQWMSSGVISLTGMSTGIGRKRFLLTHAAGVDSLDIYFKQDNGILVTKTLTKTFLSSNQTLKLGYSASSGGALPGGTIKLCRIFDRVVSQDEQNEFFE